ncbi:PglL family O-oligosaccharyltransferase [Noviherbaspirillum aridicola]|uniref:Virulence factor membrane-bound polymerase C-terminal domain-containing protein n=1 Tax=Noviherbaspirillum aridicola TaxID=2849687 RepID=A0ABQ4Q5E9_9BURK|nr:Wzy polymerase domain-containing protein [Noviherbaspirillum aridicola]GIZ52424.1 hypothetical protein NCCP691_24380 [Noviherbaspirillum aridicola]
MEHSIPSARASFPAGEARVDRSAASWLATGAVAAAFLFPFLWPLHASPIQSFVNEWLAAVLMLLAAGGGALVARRHGDSLPIPFVGLVFGALAAVIALQWALGLFTHSSNATLPLMALLLALLSACVGTICARHIGLSRLLPLVCSAAVVGGVLNVLLQVVQLLTNNGVSVPLIRFATGGSLYGALGQQNHLATYLCWALIGCGYLHARRLLPTMLAVLLTAVFLAGLTMSTSRMTWLQVGCIGIAGVLLLRRIDPAARPRGWQWLILLPAGYYLVSLLLPQLMELAQFDPLRSSLGRLATEEVGGPRRKLIEQAWAIFLAHPILGVGPGEFAYHQFMLEGSKQGVVFPSSPHNLLFDLLSMTGLAGTLLFAAILLPALMRILHGAVTLERVCAVLMLAVFGIHTLLEFPQWYAYFLLPAAFLFGAVETKIIAPGQHLLARIAAPVAVVYGLGLSAVLFVQYQQLEQLYSHHYMKNRLVSEVDPGALASIENFERRSVFDGPAEFLLCFNFALNENALERKLAISARALRHRAEPNIVYRHVILLALAGRQHEGSVYLQRLRENAPDEYEEVAQEIRRLGQDQPGLFGGIAASLQPGNGQS